MRLTKLSLLLAVFLSGSAWTVTYCTTREIGLADPHQASDQVNRFIFSQHHASLFSSPEIVRNIKQLKPTSWLISLKPGIRFHGPAKNLLTAEDVAFSLNRQLIRNTDYESDEEAFLPAKLNGLDKLLQSIVVRSATDFELNFSLPVSETQLRSLIDVPVGTILPKTFTGKNPPSGAGKLPLRKSDPGFVVVGIDESSGITIKMMAPDQMNLESLKKEQCKRLYYPSQDLIEGVKAKRVKGALIRTSTTLLYLRLFPEIILTPVQIERLRAAVHPDRLKALKEGEKTNRIFAVSSHGPSRVDPLKSADILPLTIATCDHVALPSQTRSSLESQLEKSFLDAFGITINWDRIGCSRIVNTRHNPDRLGTLSSLEFRSTEELTRMMDCELTSTKVFNVCSSGSNEVREAEILKNGRIFPLARISNEFIEFF